MRSCAALTWVMAARTRASLQAVLCVKCSCAPLGPAHIPGAGLCELRAAEMGQEQLSVCEHTSPVGCAGAWTGLGAVPGCSVPPEGLSDTLGIFGWDMRISCLLKLSVRCQ